MGNPASTGRAEPPPASARANTDPRRGRMVALGAMVAASALIAATTLIAKALGLGAGGEALHPLQISAGRFAFALITLSFFALWLRPDFAGARWSLHVGRSVCGWAGVTLMFAAAARIPLADATAISFLSPLVTMGLAIAFLGERIGRWRWTAAAISVCGAIVLLRPGTDAFHLAALLALGAALLMGAEAVFIKRLSDTEPPLRILIINNLIGTMIAGTAAAAVWTGVSAQQWLLLAMLGIAMVSAQALFIQALRRTDASFAVPLFYLTLVFAAAYDFALFGQGLATATVIGATLIVAGAVVISVRGDRQ